MSKPSERPSAPPSGAAMPSSIAATLEACKAHLDALDALVAANRATRERRRGAKPRGGNES